MRRLFKTKLALASSLALAVVCVGAQSALAAAPGPSNGSATAPASSLPSAEWLAMKNAYRVRSGVKRNQSKGTASHVYIDSTPMKLRQSPQSATPYSIVVCDPNSTPPCSDELSTSNTVPYILEPGAGVGGSNNYPGANSSYAGAGDDNFHLYGTDAHFWNWCGPGAADVAMWYWPKPTNDMNVSATDPDQTSTSVLWNGKDRDYPQYPTGSYIPRRERGYMTNLAWKIQPTGWSLPGMMDQYGRGQGVRLQEEATAMDWEETGHSSTGGFYIVAWTGVYGEGNFHSDVSSDIYYNNVPVVAEVNARLLPNWDNNGGRTLHFVTVIGYDDNVHNSDGTYGIYYYTDTCGNATGCGSNSNAGIHQATQSQMWKAIANVPYSQSTGDGGWVW
jgi:hypothetical protein